MYKCNNGTYSSDSCQRSTRDLSSFAFPPLIKQGSHGYVVLIPWQNMQPAFLKDLLIDFSTPLGNTWIP